MKRRFEFIRERYRNTFITILFLLTIAIIAFLFPDEGKFRFEFQKGEPWLHENLVAPYDFAIYKLESELNNELDSIKNSNKPYFKYTNNISERQLKSIHENFKTNWSYLLLLIDSIDQTRELQKKKKISPKLNRWSKKKYEKKISEILQYVYSKGIIDLSDDVTVKEKTSIIIIRNNIAEEYKLKNIFTIDQAFVHITKEIEAFLKDNDIEIPDEQEIPNIGKHFINMFDMFDYLEPNVFYDEKTTINTINNNIDNVSLTKGMVKKGEGIILKGVTIDLETYRKLISLKKEYETLTDENISYSWILLGHIVLIFSSILILFLFLLNFRRDIFHSGLKTSFILVIFLLSIIAARGTVNSGVLNLYIMPLTILPIVIRTFYDSRLALFVHIIAVLLIGFFAPNSFEFVLLQFIAGAVAIFSLTTLHRRGQLFTSSVLVTLTYCFVYFGMAIIQEGDIKAIKWINFAWFAGNGMLLLVSYPLIYMFERLFGFLSDVTLIELSNSNSRLLRDLAENAPGTFQHSLQVANLAEDAIYTIGGNPLLVRVGALYHDIGKIPSSEFFTENQATENNPHDNLTLDQSSEIIIGHVAKGIELAKKHKIPEQVIDFIRTHHGVNKALYFYRSFKNKYPDKEIDMKKFTYPGPKPSTKETSVLMMADAVEAASRSLKVITEETISGLVENIINFQIKEEQHSMADITFKEVTMIKEQFKKKLKNIYHARIEYPKEIK